MSPEECNCDDSTPLVEEGNVPIPPPANPNGKSALTEPAEKAADTKIVTNGVGKGVTATKEGGDTTEGGEKDKKVEANGTDDKEDGGEIPEDDEKSKATLEITQLQMALNYIQRELALRGVQDSKFPVPPYPGIPPPPPPPGMYSSEATRRPAADPNSPVPEKAEKKAEEEVKPVARIRGSKKEFRRLDELYDKGKNTFYLAETHTTSSQKEDEWEEYVFIVKRKFDWQNRFIKSVIDIKSAELHGLLRDHVLKGIQGISLVEEKPSIIPNDLFNYQPQIEDYLAKEKEKPEDKQDQKLIEHTELLLDFLNEDYAEVKAHLIPLLEHGEITFDLLWALFLPNSLLFTYCPGSHEPQCLKLDYGEYQCSPARGKFFQLETHLINFDGKKFFRKKLIVEIYEFRGSRRIDDLPFFPLAYHEREDEIITQLISRGREFCKLDGSHNKAYKGIAFHTSKQGLTRVNVDGRVMVDAATFRYINPNYQCAQSRSHGVLNGGPGMVDPNALPTFGEEDGNGSCGAVNAIKSIPPPPEHGQNGMSHLEKTRNRLFRRGYILKDGKMQLVGGPSRRPKEKKKTDEYHAGLNPKNMTEEELLLCSPTVLGFSFPDKLWLELAVANIHEIEWNSDAFDSLVLPTEQKNIVRALVESHTINKSRNGFDDVVKGKGKGLVAVLHGRPGVGKTLTAEGISEYLKRPLYMVSVGELGTDARTLEHQLSRILEVAHIWGAVLLLDEADVFLERRSVHDLHRNALVSIFLRLLEYFQGILFLTTNRVETFDEAFQSRIHIALRYNDLDQKAKKQIWKTFLNLVEKDIRSIAAEEAEKAAAEEAATKQEESKEEVSDKLEQKGENGVLEDKAEEKLPPAKQVHLVDPEGWTKIVSKGELEWLSKRHLNGRQIKNAVRTAHALSGNTKESLNIKHLKTVLQVTESFENDLKGTGQLDSMMSYA
ncbi:P-loop containing nucleoside triphosphate hydrolase protein [Ascobolus immersus RN42]|uniref:P-loop containing nucleoside triphosphate hydrolase protein n=1 Tax=Ascobolus immersus RN42 TaxID=1160509 RepID=A0A3N4I5Q4_ASCIM|nr:P-loop containing nucleoside triphosphate hydrolase protein [Ascobolus immersus RN42]